MYYLTIYLWIYAYLYENYNHIYRTISVNTLRSFRDGSTFYTTLRLWCSNPPRAPKIQSHNKTIFWFLIISIYRETLNYLTNYYHTISNTLRLLIWLRIAYFVLCEARRDNECRRLLRCLPGALADTSFRGQFCEWSNTNTHRVKDIRSLSRRFIWAELFNIHSFNFLKQILI